MRPTRRAVLGLVAAFVAVAVVLGVRVAWAEASSHPQRAAVPATPEGLVSRSVPTAFAAERSSGPGASGVGGTGASPLGRDRDEAHPATAPATGGAGGSGPSMVVHVVGQVRRPGVVRLPAGARVLEAVQAAGGPTQRADLAAVNLARVIQDGEQLLVPRPGQRARPVPAPMTGSPSEAAAATAAPVDLNSADATALEQLPGVGPVLAQRILQWRQEHRRFSSVDELGEVSGIGPKVLAQLRPRVTV